MESFTNFIGIIGVLLMLASFFMSQQGTLTVNEPRYLWMNFIGAFFVVISLFCEWNLPSFFIETAWAAISGYGIIKLRQKI